VIAIDKAEVGLPPLNSGTNLWDEMYVAASRIDKYQIEQAAAVNFVRIVLIYLALWIIFR